MAAVLPFATSPDPRRFPVHRLGTWQHALTCQVAGVPVPPESAEALAVWDKRVRGGATADLSRDSAPRVSVGVQSSLDRSIRHAAQLRRLATAVVSAGGGVMDVELAARRTARAHDDVAADEVVAAILAQAPVDVADPGGTYGVRRYTTDAGVHLAVSSVPHLRRCLGLPAHPWQERKAPALEVVPDVPEVEDLPAEDEAPDVPEAVPDVSDVLEPAEDEPEAPVEAVPDVSDVPVEVLQAPAPGYHRLTRRVVCEARRRVVDEAAEVPDLAPEYGVEVEALADAVVGRTWGHIRRPAPVAEVPELSA